MSQNISSLLKVPLVPGGRAFDDMGRTAAVNAFEQNGRRHDPSDVVEVDNGKCEVKFNVMDSKSVSESFNIKDYNLWPYYIEGRFDRDYKSEMKNSPDHLIFLTGLIHCQRMIYTYLCYHFNAPYSQMGDEQFKIWTVKLDISMPDMLVVSEDVIQKMVVTGLKKIGDKKYVISVRSKFNDMLEWSGSCVVYDIRT